MNQALGARGVKRTDEMRRAREEMDSEAYREMTYYERWIASMEAILIEKKILTKEEIDRKLGGVRNQMGRAVTSDGAKFKPGIASVFVSRTGRDTSARRGTSAGRPDGSSGPMVNFLNPELLAYGRDDTPRRTLYLVAFNHTDVWGSAEGAQDKVLVDIYEHWLDAAN